MGVWPAHIPTSVWCLKKNPLFRRQETTQWSLPGTRPPQMPNCTSY